MKFATVILLALGLGQALLAAQDEGAVAPVVFSMPSQTFTEPFLLELHCETPGAEIFYSIDGHPLTIFTSRIYRGPLEISDTAWIRAQAVTSDGTSALTSGQYIRLAEDLADFRSPLPILLLENFGQGEVPSKQWNQTGAGVQQVDRQRAQWFLFHRNDSGRSRLLGIPDETSRLGVRVRGAFSSSFPRKPFSVETWDENDLETGTTPLGLPGESDWILYPPNAQYDRTLLYNTWLYELSRMLGGNAVRFRFTEAFVHTRGGPLSMEDHAGVYVLMEKVKRDDDRLDFPKLSEDGTRGGWLLSINRMDPIPVDGFPTPNGATTPQFFHTPGPDRILQTPPNEAGRGDDIPRQANAFINFESPNGYTINPQQRAAIEDWFKTFEDVLYNDNYRDPEMGYARFLDIDNFIDYFILHDITRNTDGLLISMWVYKEGPEAKLKMGPVWDYDLAYRDAPESGLGLNRDRLWYRRLWQDPDFEQRYIDRWQSLRSGPMADDAIHALIDKQAAEITEPVARAHGIGDWPSRLTAWKAWLAERAGAIDKQFELRPTFSTAGGSVARGTQVSLKAGTIFAPRDVYYTTDGTDPRSPGGEPAFAAQLLESSIAIERTIKIRARVRHENTWSGLSEAWFFVDEAPATSDALQISKIHYHPSNPNERERDAGLTNDDDFEFIELKNVGPQAIHLGGVRFTDGIAFAFDESVVQVMPPGERLLLASNQVAFEYRYGKALLVAGEYTGKLRNSGERLQMTGFNGERIADVSFDDREPWPRSADGDGPSLVRLPEILGGPADEAFAWRSSLRLDGAPGVEDTLDFGDGDPWADPDQDGIPALVEFALGTESNENAHPITLIFSGDTLLLRFPRALAAGDVRLDLEVSSDLQTWESLTDFTQTDRHYHSDGVVEERFAIPRAAAWKYLRLRAEKF